MITIVDYGLGNVRAFCNVYHRLGIGVSLVQTADELSKAVKLILPGVGAFDWAMLRLKQSGMRERLDELVLERGIPVLGVCVGMQMMASSSEEGTSPGLGWIDGRVRRLGRGIDDVKDSSAAPQLPHIGWNSVRATNGQELFADISDPRFYFLHSYYYEPLVDSSGLAVTNYIHQFASAVGRNNIYGVQFHPEKSHLAGIQLLKNFAEL